MRSTRWWAGTMAAATVAAMTIPAGAVEAQTVRAGHLSSSQEVGPPFVPSPGTGFGVVTLDATQQFLTVNETFSNLLQPTIDAHIHAPGPAGSNAPVAIPFTGVNGFVTGSTSGSYSHVFDLLLTSSYSAGFLAANGGTAAGARAAFVNHFLAGNTYLNVHTSARPAGEIRGQLSAVPEPSTYALMASGLGIVGMISWRRRRTT